MAASGGDAKLFARVRSCFSISSSALFGGICVYYVLSEYRNTLEILCHIVYSLSRHARKAMGIIVAKGIRAGRCGIMDLALVNLMFGIEKHSMGNLTQQAVPRANTYEQGKVAELRLELNSGGKKDKNHSAKKIALKKIVANMTMSNNDMVALFPDVVGCMQIPSLEIKKMCGPPVQCELVDMILTQYRCFLFLVNYARIKPEVALKALPVLVTVCMSQPWNVL